jgi:hypothetical protein
MYIHRSEGREAFDVKNERHLEYGISQPVDVYLVIRQQDESSEDGVGVTHKNRRE